jgi:hypothetical protein
MYRRALFLVGGVIATLAISDLATSGTQNLPLFGSGAASDQSNVSVERERKGDRLATPRSRDNPRTISVVEIIGVNNTAIVYRDRDGRELYRTDPVENVTIVVRDVVLPEVTIRERPESVLQEMPTPEPRDAKEGTQLEGCDPIASPLAAPTFANRLGRCLAAHEVLPRVVLASNDQ